MGTPRLWGPICTQGPWRSPSLLPRGLDAEALLTLVIWLEGASQAQGERAGARPIPTSIVDTPTSGPGPVSPFLLPVYR